MLSMTDFLSTIKPPGLRNNSLCRPIGEQEAREIVYKKHFPLQELTIAIRPLCLHTDIETIFDWVNLEFARQMWQKDNGPMRQLKQTYELILQSDFAQSFVAVMNDSLVCQLDVYNAAKNEISLVYQDLPGDYGINILMSPAFDKASGLSVCILQTFLEYFFTMDEVHRIIGEPSIDDLPANELLMILGFQLQKKINLSYKYANLHTCTRANFREAICTFVH
jgi:hypothetical protein